MFQNFAEGPKFGKSGHSDHRLKVFNVPRLYKGTHLHLLRKHPTKRYKT